MSDELPPCPACAELFTYQSGSLLVCPMCGHEWVLTDPAAGGGDSLAPAERLVKDAVGNVLADGDDVTTVKDLKVKGAGGGVVKVGTKVRGIRLISDGVGDHDIRALLLAGFTIPTTGRQLGRSTTRVITGIQAMVVTRMVSRASASPRP